MWTRTRPVGDDEEPVLDRAAFDDRCARLERHLLEEARHRDQRVAGNLTEQRDALEHRDALDRQELAHARAGVNVSVSTRTSCKPGAFPMSSRCYDCVNDSAGVPLSSAAKNPCEIRGIRLLYEHMFDTLADVEVAVEKLLASECAHDVARLRRVIERLECAWLASVREAERSVIGKPTGS